MEINKTSVSKKQCYDDLSIYELLSLFKDVKKEIHKLQPAQELEDR